jgi:transposase
MRAVPSASDLPKRAGARWARGRPAAQPGGRRRSSPLRARLKGSCSVLRSLRSGCRWRRLAPEFPPWSSGEHSCRRWRLDGRWARRHPTVRARVRARAGRQPPPSAALRASPSINPTARGGPPGDAGAKKLSGRHRHLLVAPRGVLLQVAVPVATRHDREGAKRRLAPRGGSSPAASSAGATTPTPGQ